MADFADDRVHARKERPSTTTYEAEPQADGAHQHQELGHLDRLWTKSATAGQGATSSAASQAAQPTTSDTVLTKWMLNYSAVTGRRKDPTRTSADQLVVDELRIQPDDASRGPALLRGGNRARVGRVHLGDAEIAKGPGTVAALVRYEKRSAFDVKLKLDQKPTRAERQKLAALDREVTQRAEEEASLEGNYGAIAAQLEQEYAGEFPGKKLSIAIVPAPPRKGTAAEEGAYVANGPGTFEVSIDPASQTEHTYSTSKSVSGEETQETSRTEGSKTTTEETQWTKGTEVHERTEKFTSMLQAKVSVLFKHLQEQVNGTIDSNVHEHSEKVNWKLGLGQESDKDDKDGQDAAAKKKKGGGVLDWVWNTAKGGARWIYAVGKKRVPLLWVATEVAGSIWDTITARGNISRGSTETVTDTKSHSRQQTNTTGREITSFGEIANAVTSEILATHRIEIEEMVGTKLGTEISSGETGSKGEKKTTSTTYTSSSSVTEATRPRIRIRKLGGA